MDKIRYVSKCVIVNVKYQAVEFKQYLISTSGNAWLPPMASMASGSNEFVLKQF